MNFSIFVPLLIPITVAIFLPVLSSLGKRKGEGVARNIYGYSIGLQVFIWIGTFFFALMPIGFESFGIILRGWDWVASLLFVLLMVAGGIYMKSYKVVLDDNGLAWGSFWRKGVGYESIHSAELKASGRGSVFLIVKYANKGQVALSGDLQDFDDLAKRLSQKIRR